MSITLLSLPDTAHAQITPEETRAATELFGAISRADAYMARLERLRLAGDCTAFSALLDQSYQYLAAPVLRASGQRAAELLEKYSTELAEMRTRPCPPVTAQPPAASAAQMSVGDAPATSILDEAGIPTGGVEGSIPPPPPAAPTTAPPPQGVSPLGTIVLIQQRNIDDIERSFASAEAIRLTGGDCTTRLETLDEVRQKLIHGDFDSLPPEMRRDIHRRLDEAANRPCPPGATVSHNSIQIAGGYGEMGIPRGNYGFRRDGPFGTAPELPALLSVPRVPVLVIEGAATFQGIGRFNLGYREGDGRNFVDLPTGPAGTARGFPYTALSPSGSTGITGNVPVRIDNFVEVQEFSAGLHIPISYGIQDKLTPGVIHDGGSTMWAPSTRLGLFFNTFIVFRDRNHGNVVSITTPVIATQTLDLGRNVLKLAAQPR
ncbi:MAG: hypothetical protein ABL874_06550 [Sphingopyxis sp.]